jgi:hypothetical protein
MPVDFMVGEGHTLACQSPAMFDAVYKIGSEMAFDAHPPFNPPSMLTQCLNEVSGYLNAIIMTPRPDAALYERIVNGINNGHYIAVIYFATLIKNPDAEQIYRLLTENNMPCFRITEESLIDEKEEAA